MNSTKFIEECKKYDLGTEIYLTDDSGNEYDIEEIGAVMFGQPHLCIKLKNYGPSKDILYGFPHNLPEWIMDGNGKVWNLLIDKDNYKLYYGDETSRFYEVDYSGDIKIERAVESMRNVLKFNGYV